MKNMNETLKTILSRRSVRAYQARQIKEEELQAILEAGQYAPSGMNAQPWHFSVIQDPALLQKINDTIKAELVKSGPSRMAERAKDESFSVFYQAPTLIVVSGDPDAVTPRYDCTLALGNMLLAAASVGVGSCWINAVAKMLIAPECRPLLREIGVSEGYTLYGAGAFGYHAGPVAAAAPRKAGAVNFVR
jgi:nitroreductase